MTTKTEALKLALEALEANQPVNYCMNSNGERFPMMQEDPFRFERNIKAISAIKEALAVDKESLTTEARHMPSNDSLYKAWNLIGADLAGLKFEDFVRHLSAQQNAERVSNEQVEPVAWRAWFDADNSAKWLFTLWPEEEHPSFDWQPLYTHPPVPTAQPKEPEQEPMAWAVMKDGECLSVRRFEPAATSHADGVQFVPLYTTPPQRKPLTDELADALKTVLKWVDDFCETDEHFAESVEAKADAALEKYEAAHGIKENT